MLACGLGAACNLSLEQFSLMGNKQGFDLHARQTPDTELI